MTTIKYTPNELENEIWKPIPGFSPDYLISNYGRCKKVSENRIIKPYKGGWKGKYLRYSLGSQMEYVHRIVLFAFAGQPPDKSYQCNHKDGNKHNNHIDNLEWVTPLENQQHRYDVLGKTQNGIHNGSNKYSREQIQEILDLYAEGKYTQRKIAEITGIHYKYVNQIVHGKAWAHLQD